MSLLNLEKVKKEFMNGPVDEDKTFNGILKGQVAFLTQKGKYHSHWTDISCWSAIACSLNTSVRYHRNSINKKLDKWGRIKRTELWA